jgi:hypothetical protein
MIIIPVPNNPKMVDNEGNILPDWGNYFDQNTQQMQQSLSNEGIWAPSVSSASDSVDPPTTGGQIAQLEASFGTQTGVNAGTIIFDPAEVNGGSSGSPNGQLKVLLADGVFHKINNA